MVALLPLFLDTAPHSTAVMAHLYVRNPKFVIAGLAQWHIVADDATSLHRIFDCAQRLKVSKPPLI